jgi:transposase
MEVLTMIGIGIDTHKATLAVSAVDELGRELDRTTVRNDRPGHAALARWVVRLGSERRVGIEGSGGFGAALAQALLTAGESVFEVPPTLTARERRRLRSHGKSDPADAIAIARVVAREGTLPIVREWTSSDDLRLIVTARDELLAERTRVADRLHADLLVLTPGLW